MTLIIPGQSSFVNIISAEILYFKALFFSEMYEEKIIFSLYKWNAVCYTPISKNDYCLRKEQDRYFHPTICYNLLLRRNYL